MLYISIANIFCIIFLPIQQIDNQQMLPPQLVDIVGKTYGFGISVDENSSSCAGVSNAMQVWTLNDIIWKRTKALHQISASSRKKQCLEVVQVENKDPSKAKENKSG